MKRKKRHRVLSKSESTRWVGVLDVRVLPRVQGDQMHPSPLSPKVVEVKCSSKGLAARDSPVLHIPHRLITRHLKASVAAVPLAVALTEVSALFVLAVSAACAVFAACAAVCAALGTCAILAAVFAAGWIAAFAFALAAFAAAFASSFAFVAFVAFATAFAAAFAAIAATVAAAPRAAATVNDGVE